MENIDIWKEIKKLKPIIDEEISKVIPKEHYIKHLYEEVHYHLESGGKRWRPALCIFVCEALGGSKDEALPFAAGIEILHNFSLIHDDIEDEDEYRRDRPSLWKKIGIARAINVGDGMFAKAFESVTKGEEVGISPEKNFELLKILSNSATNLMEGQAMDMNSRFKTDITEQEYMEMVSKKTGALVSASVLGGAVITGVSSEIKNSLKEYGKKLGIAFQIADDLLDFTEEKGRGGEIGNDIKEGKRSLMVVHYITKSEKPDELLNILDKPREKTTEEDVELAMSLLESEGSIEYAKQKMEELTKEAITLLNPIPESKQKGYLEQIARFTINRDF